MNPSQFWEVKTEDRSYYCTSVPSSIMEVKIDLLMIYVTTIICHLLSHG